jgi:NAD-dependent SIR2 family protein deacetylase
MDRLHQKSGSRHVIDLHGRNDQVKCMSCDHQLPREVMQDTLRKNNQEFLDYVNSHVLRPEDTRADGDMELGAIDYHQLDVPNCPLCDGILKPNVVFFGDNVPVNIVNEIYSKVSVLNQSIRCIS